MTRQARGSSRRRRRPRLASRACLSSRRGSAGGCSARSCTLAPTARGRRGTCTAGERRRAPTGRGFGRARARRTGGIGGRPAGGWTTGRDAHARAASGGERLGVARGLPPNDRAGGRHPLLTAPSLSSCYSRLVAPPRRSAASLVPLFARRASPSFGHVTRSSIRLVVAPPVVGRRAAPPGSRTSCSA